MYFYRFLISPLRILKTLFFNKFHNNLTVSRYLFLPTKGVEFVLRSSPSESTRLNTRNLKPLMS